MQSLKNSFSDLQKSIGEQFIPILVSAIESIQPFIEKVIEWTSAHPELTRNLILVTLAVTGLVAVIGTLGLLLPPIIAFFGLLSPPVLVVTGIIAGLILTVTNLIKIFTILKEDSALVWDGIVITIQEAGSAIMGVFDKIKNGVMAIVEKVRNLIDAFKELNIVQGAKNVGSKIISSIGNLFRADGGPVSSGNPYIVGERGPELFTPNSNGSIIPNHKLAGAGGITINISGNTLLDGSAGEKLAAQIMRTLKQNLRI
jgi:phage-related protein